MYEIKDERDYAIRKGKVLERFNEEFWTRHKNSVLYRQVYEYLIRDAEPYTVIEKLLDINLELAQKIREIMPWVSPHYKPEENATKI